MRRLRLEPIRPPVIPPIAMQISMGQAKSGTLPLKRVINRLAAWEYRMIYREFSAAVLVSMEKK